MSEVQTGTDTGHGGEHVDEERRDFIHIMTGATAAAGVVMFAWPLIDQMNPALDTKALSSLDVDISKIPLGGEARVLVGGQPFLIRHRTEREIAKAREEDSVQMRDPEPDEERLIPGPDGNLRPEILVVSGACTHLGCVPVGPAQGNVGDYGGWYCPCHGSHYDTSGRIRKGPAPTNLPVPDYRYISDTVIQISL